MSIRYRTIRICSDGRGELLLMFINYVYERVMLNNKCLSACVYWVDVICSSFSMQFLSLLKILCSLWCDL